MTNIAQMTELAASAGGAEFERDCPIPLQILSGLVARATPFAFA